MKGDIRTIDPVLNVVRRWVGSSEEWVRRFLAAAPKDRTIAAIVVMGSSIRERGHPRSDFDLLVLHRGKRPHLRAPAEVDIRFYSMDTLEDRAASGDEILCWALKYGFPLYDPDGKWEALQRTWHNKTPMPSADAALERGRRSLRIAEEMVHAGDESAGNDFVLAAATQFARTKLIRGGIFPASRPELPSQLREIIPLDPFANP